jgi:ubiquinone/menaquinone biosynthesis C-methylase UbiE
MGCFKKEGFQIDNLGGEMLEFTDEASQLASDYVKNVEAEVRSFTINLKPQYVKMLAFDIENDVRFFALKAATKRRSQRVEVVDVREVFKKLGKPEEFVKSHIGKAQNCEDSQRNTFGNLETMREKLQKIETPIVLDAGCRWGRASKRLKDFCSQDLEIVGVDLDKLSLQYGKTMDKTAVFIRSDIRALPFRSQVFDLILCSGVIHEVKDTQGRRNAIGEMSRALKSKGSLYLVDAFAKLQIISAFTFVLQHVSHDIEWIPKKDAIEKMLRKSGLQVVSVKGSGSHLRSTIVPYTIEANKASRTKSS